MGGESLKTKLMIKRTLAKLNEWMAFKYIYRKDKYRLTKCSKNTNILKESEKKLHKKDV